MKKLNNNQKNRDQEITPEKIEFERKLKVIQKAQETSALMSVLCQQLGLTPYKTTHQEFVNKFSALQKESLDYQKELQEHYIATSESKVRKRRTKEEMEEEAASITAKNSETDEQYQSLNERLNERLNEIPIG